MPNFELIRNVCDDDFNQFTINLLREQGGWRLSPDHYDTKIEADMNSTEYAKQMVGFSDTGMLLMSYTDNPHEADVNDQYQGLNTLAQYIFESILRKSKRVYQDVQLIRILWNYYNTASTGIYHVDKDFDDHKYFSVVYHLNTCDGGTIIQKKKVLSVSGNAILFDSDIPHRGIGPTRDPARYVLNILLRYSGKRLKKRVPLTAPFRCEK